MRSAVLIALLLGGCDGPSAVGAGALSLGGTALDGSGFLPLTGDQALVPGSQGGFHVWLKFRLRGVAASKIGVRRTARRSSDDRLLLQSEGTVEVGEPDGEGVWQIPTPFATFLCPSPLGVDIIDTPVRFRVVITHEDGTPIDEAESEATPRCPTDAQAQFCQSICSGH